jgi:hypothetical protein
VRLGFDFEGLFFVLSGRWWLDHWGWRVHDDRLGRKRNGWEEAGVGEMDFVGFGLRRLLSIAPLELFHAWDVLVTDEAFQDAEAVFALAADEAGKVISSLDTKDGREDLANGVCQQVGVLAVTFLGVTEDVGCVGFVVEDPVPDAELQGLFLANVLDLAFDRRAHGYFELSELEAFACLLLLAPTESQDEWFDVLDVIIDDIGAGDGLVAENSALYVASLDGLDAEEGFDLLGSGAFGQGGDIHLLAESCGNVLGVDVPGVLDGAVFFARLGPCPDFSGTDETLPGRAVADVSAVEVPEYRGIDGFGE